MRKIIFILSLSVIFFSGCSNSRKIENAAVIESVCVSQKDGDINYTFYKLSDSEKPDGISVRASSFEEARNLAEKQYIPDMTLAKLELLMIDNSLDRSVLKRDIEYISTQASVSPVAYLTMCDSAAVQAVSREGGLFKIIENQLILCKNNNSKVNIDYLNVFNSLEDCECNSFTVASVIYDGELKISTTEIVNK